MFDVWYVDDSCIICEPEDFEIVLRALDKQLKTIGVSRGTLSGGEKVKSTARIICPKEREEEQNNRAVQDRWATQYVRDSCVILRANEPTEYLGTMASGDPEDTVSMQMMFKKTQEKWEGINELQHPPRRSYSPE